MSNIILLAAIAFLMSLVILGTIVEIEDERLGKDKNYLLNSESIRNCFNWEDKITLLDGLKDTISWVDKNLDYFSKTSWEYHHKT